MDKKLTLSLDDMIIERAKLYAKQNNISLSRLIESYLASIVLKNKTDDIEISPFVKSMSSGGKIPNNILDKNEFNDHLLNKYK